VSSSFYLLVLGITHILYATIIFSSHHAMISLNILLCSGRKTPMPVLVWDTDDVLLHCITYIGISSLYSVSWPHSDVEECIGNPVEYCVALAKTKSPRLTIHHTPLTTQRLTRGNSLGNNSLDSLSYAPLLIHFTDHCCKVSFGTRQEYSGVITVV
jgi:hypothetical protein